MSEWKKWSHIDGNIFPEDKDCIAVCGWYREGDEFDSFGRKVKIYPDADLIVSEHNELHELRTRLALAEKVGALADEFRREPSSGANALQMLQDWKRRFHDALGLLSAGKVEI